MPKKNLTHKREDFVKAKLGFQSASTKK